MSSENKEFMSNSDDEVDDTGSGKESSDVREDWQHITKPGPHDVLCGRGGGTNNHKGNVKFRQTINDYKLRYLAVSKVEKPKIAREVVKIWRNLDPPGRFLARKDDSRRGPGSVKAEGNVWYDIGDKKAREKASQCLRERTPDVLPYVREMQRRQDVLTGQALSMVQQDMRLRNMNMSHQNTMAVGTQGFNSNATAMMGAAGMAGFPVDNESAAATQTMSEPDVNLAFSVEHFFTHGFQNAPNASLSNPNDPLSLQQMSQDPQLFQQGITASTSSPAQVFSGTGSGALEPLPLPEHTQVAHLKPDEIASTSQPQNRLGSGDDTLTLEEYIASMQEYNEVQQDELPQPGINMNESVKMNRDFWAKSFPLLESNSNNGDLSAYSGSLGNNNNASEANVVPKKRKVKKKKMKNVSNPERNDQVFNQSGLSSRSYISGNTNRSAISGISHQSNKSAMSGISQQSAMSATTLFSDMTDLSKTSQMSALSVMSDFTEITDLSGTLSNLELNAGSSSKS
mmetsp:Transcript_32663/g.49230  ORF Transcript_32663/g.49230 Transcript_32663/m.49230 type:complete len:512 (-) Transcript_32663:2167-3702(-)